MSTALCPADGRPASPDSARKLADQVYDGILEAIVEGEFQVGRRLPTEMALSHRFGVSRPILRQALERLRGDALIVSRQGSGSYVHRCPDRSVMDFAPVGSIAEIQRIFEFRMAIEADAAGLAAQRHDAHSLARLREALEELDRCVATGNLGAAADESFHVAVCAASDNHYFLAARASMKSQIVAAMSLNRGLSIADPVQRLHKVQQEHHRIFQAIAAGDRPAAHDAMREHLEAAGRRIFDATPRETVPKRELVPEPSTGAGETPGRR
ncbi:FadR/GntR family transcriptional regulator [Geminicoccus roseus]|uniref:FadR/GntR family transcriptional regulator n=1 Tax=Geminicoccus roseus TaxID=404900 RepID=UPI00040289D5|nr:FadR/GntR family transcriptional regulator [Geminicoccus roseus]